jgi:DNA-binding NarL/FixJ family response regulator
MTDGSQGKAGIKVFLLDDHEIVRRGVKDMLEAEADIVVIGEAGTAQSALARIPALMPDVAVLDVRLPDGDGVTVCREIRSRHPEIGCLMLNVVRRRRGVVRRDHGRRGWLRAQADPRHRPCGRRSNRGGR